MNNDENMCRGEVSMVVGGVGAYGEDVFSLSIEAVSDSLSITAENNNRSGRETKC